MVADGTTRFSDASGVRYSARNASVGSRRAASAAARRSIRPPDTSADRHDVAHAERRRLVVQHLEFRRQIAAHLRDLAVDAGDESLDQRARCGVHRLGIAFRYQIDPDGQVRDVAGHVGGAEDLGLAAQRAAAQAIHLP
jgi:hypothetical protein